MFNMPAGHSTGVETGSVRKVFTIFLGILGAFIIADTLTGLLLISTGLEGAAGMVVSFVIYAVIFFAVLHVLHRYAHIDFFGFNRK